MAAGAHLFPMAFVWLNHNGSLLQAFHSLYQQAVWALFSLCQCQRCQRVSGKCMRLFIIEHSIEHPHQWATGKSTSQLLSPKSKVRKISAHEETKVKMWVPGGVKNGDPSFLLQQVRSLFPKEKKKALCSICKRNPHSLSISSDRILQWRLPVECVFPEDINKTLKKESENCFKRKNIC